MFKVLIISIFVLLLPTQSFSKELDKKIKFHLPETEAEKVLDVVLSIENSIIRNKQNIKEEIFTKDFLKEELGQAKYYEECAKGGIWCNKNDIEHFKNISHITGSRYKESNHNFFYFTFGDTAKLIFIDMYSILRSSAGQKIKNDNLYLSEESFDFKYRTIHYAMKKENGKWKIDGICTGGIKINHPVCYCLCIIDYNDIDSFE